MSRRWRRIVLPLLAVLATLAMLTVMAGCGAAATATPAPTATTAAPAATEAPAPTAAPAATEAPTQAPAATEAPTAAPTAAPTVAPTAAAPAGSQAERAIELGKKFKGTTINLPYEGIQAGAIKLMAPVFEKATGMKVNIVEVSFAEIVQKVITEHEAATGAFDIIPMAYSSIPDLAAAGAIQPIDDYASKYLTKDDINNIEPGHRIGMLYYDDKMWGMPADGDLFILYYRTDIFGDKDNQAAYKAKFGKDLAPPTTWDEYNQIAQFLTERGKGQYYGAATQHDPDQSFYYFAQVFQSMGGKWFDADTMKPLINSDLGLKALKQYTGEIKFGPPGVEKWGAVELWSAWVDGKLAMQYSWPPGGRFSEAASGVSNYPSWLPPTKIAGKVDYALLPGPSSQLAAPWVWGMSPDSKNKDAAWAFIQWFTAADTQLTVEMLPNSLIDPHLISDYEAPAYRAWWPNAGKYLDTLREAGKYATLDMKMLGGTEYQDAVNRAVNGPGGTDAQLQSRLDDAAGKFGEITNRLGLDKVKESYQSLLKLQDQVRAAAQGE